MLEFKQDDTAASLILTLKEKVTLTSPNYLFIITHVLTKNVVRFVKLFSDEESLFTSRYNQFTIDPSSVFAGQEIGEWHYNIYQQSSIDNTDPALAEGLLENGKLILDRATEFEFPKYDSSTCFKTYNG